MNDVVYLDWAASSPIRYFASDYAKYWMNPNSSHKGGLEANQALTEAKDRIKKTLGVNSGVVLFCRCASEAVEWLCRQFIEYDGYSQSYCSKYEHNSVIDNVGDCVTYSRSYDCDEIYLHQHTNHITGTVFDIESIGKQVQSTGTFFGSDITASLGHYPLPENLDTFCDALWFSGRKIQCETIGAIWLSDRLFKYLGGDESHMIAGTPNVPGAIALSYAMEHAVENVKTNNKQWDKLAGLLMDSLAYNGVEALIYNDLQNNKTWAINAICLRGINADALVQYLSSQGIYISPGHSACSNDEVEASRVLEAFGLTKEQASQTVRVSFGEDSTAEDVDTLVKGIVEFKNLFV